MEFDDWTVPMPLGHAKREQFPADVLPLRFEMFVLGEAESTQTPLDLAGIFVLASCCTALAGRVEIRGRDGWVEPLNLYLAVVLPPAARKSAVFSHAVEPIEEFERMECERMAESSRAARTRRDVLEGQIKRLKDQASRCDDGQDREQFVLQSLEIQRELDRLVVPERPRLIADDCTPERLASLLSVHGGRIAVLSPEGEFFELVAGRYTKSGAPNLNLVLKGHSGDRVRVDRANRAEFIDRPAITIGLAIQPGVLLGLANKPTFRDRGLLARFLYSLPESGIGWRNADPPAMPSSTVRDYRAALMSLLNLPPGTDSQGNPAPHVLTLSHKARQYLIQFRQLMEGDLAETARLGHMQDWAGKLPGQVLRIAGILHCAWSVEAGTVPWLEEVSVETMSRAIRLGNYFMAHAEIAFGEMGADPDLAGARLILNWIERSDCTGFTRREIHQALRGRFRKVTDIVGPLSILEENDYIRSLPPQEHNGPGRKPSPVYEANPNLARNPQNSRNASEWVGFEDSEDNEEKKTGVQAP